MADEMMVKELEQVVVRFSGDSGDGMQLAGNIFSNVSATVGNDICTFPDYPADIRAPQGSLTGVFLHKYNPCVGHFCIFIYYAEGFAKVVKLNDLAKSFLVYL